MSAEATSRVEVLPDPEAVARRAADLVAVEAAAAVTRRGRFLLATSGGTTPLRMFALLAELPLPWGKVELFQVDERVAPAGHPDRNLTRLRELLLDRVPLPASQVHAMPVEATDLEAAANRYRAALCWVAGRPPRLDLVHLGLGVDGHTASLVPGDPVLDARDAEVALTRAFRGHRRMTLTLPTLAAARRRLWVVTGEDKAPAVARLLAGDPAIPATRLPREGSLLLVDRAAAGEEA